VSYRDPAFTRRTERLTAGGRGLAGVDVADDDHVDVHLFFTANAISRMHCVWWGTARLCEAAKVDSPHVCGIGGVVFEGWKVFEVVRISCRNSQ
jgi:hypothetical protein